MIRSRFAFAASFSSRCNDDCRGETLSELGITKSVHHFIGDGRVWAISAGAGGREAIATTATRKSAEDETACIETTNSRLEAKLPLTDLGFSVV
jgi:hypothetical protein